MASTGSELEDTLAWQMRVAKLPPFERELVFAKSIGRKWRFDFAFPQQRLAIEVEGATWANGRHNRGAGFHEDCIKYSSAATLGWRLIRLDKDMIEDGTGLSLIEAALAWTGEEAA